MNLKIQLNNLDASGKVDLALSSLDDANSRIKLNRKKKYFSVSASIKPYISLVWIGVVVMVLGFFVAQLHED
jgi:cytochrome c-type biogenesis protein CcmF